MPFLCFSVALFIGTLGICVDLMRDFQTAHQLEFAAQTAALYGLSMESNTDGSYSTLTAPSNIENAIMTAGGDGWNQAEVGPVGNLWRAPVSFGQSDIAFVGSGSVADPTDILVQLSARRDGSDSLHQFFLPAFSTSFPPSSSPQGGATVTAKESIEVVNQPASRVGPGAPGSANNATRAGQLAGFAAFPLAISLTQYAAMANTANIAPPHNTITIDMVGSKTTAATQANHVKGCFVNVAATNGGASYYDAAQGNNALSELQALLNYFAAGSSSQVVAPAMVERGSQLNAFDPADAKFAAQQTQIFNWLNSARTPSTRFLIVPVIAADPSFSATNRVTGFARLQLTNVVPPANGKIAQITAVMGESVSMRNASSATGFSAIPTNLGVQMPAPIVPFSARTYDSASGAISARARGIVMAPALSPRRVIANAL
jgi:hypothetical protein